MDYNKQFTKLKELLKETDNTNIVRDFFIQLQLVRSLDKSMILQALDGTYINMPSWINDMTTTDLRNIVVFLMWKEFQTVIDTKESIYNEESKLGTKIEDLTTILETKYYVEQIHRIEDARPISYVDWIKLSIEEKGLVHTIEELVKMIRS